MSAVCNHKVFACSPALAASLFNFFQNIESVNYRPKNNVSPVEPRRFFKAEKKLRSVCIRPSIGSDGFKFLRIMVIWSFLRQIKIWTLTHWQDTTSSVLKVEILVSKFFSINRFSTSPITSCEISTLKKSYQTNQV